MLDLKLRRIVRTIEETFHVKHKDFCTIVSNEDVFSIVFESSKIKVFVEVNLNLDIQGIDFRQSDIRLDVFESYRL